MRGSFPGGKATRRFFSPTPFPLPSRALVTGIKRAFLFRRREGGLTIGLRSVEARSGSREYQFRESDGTEMTIFCGSTIFSRESIFDSRIPPGKVFSRSPLRGVSRKKKNR